MADAARSQGDGGMIAILKGTPSRRGRSRQITASPSPTTTPPGSSSSPGRDAQLRRAAAAARDDGLRVLRLDVAGAFHSPAMAAAADGFEAALADVELKEARVPVFSCSTARPFVDVRAELAAALTSPVLWRQTLLALRDGGVVDFVDAGPGRSSPAR